VNADPNWIERSLTNLYSFTGPAFGFQHESRDSIKGLYFVIPCAAGGSVQQSRNG
jgi:hypothetical protein